VGGHKKQYDLVLPMLKKISNKMISVVQEMFMKCIKSWFKYPEIVIPGASSIDKMHCALLKKAISEQEWIGWHLVIRGYLSRH
jgi:hypothetical protein